MDDVRRPRLAATSVTVGSPAPRESAQFWARLLGYRVAADEPPGPGDPPEGGWALVAPDGDEVGLSIALEHEREYRPPVWPAQPGAQVATQHIDVHVADGDLAGAVAWAVACGARLAEHQPQEEVRVLYSPDGHPFCLYL